MKNLIDFNKKKNELFVTKMNQKLRSADLTKWYQLKGLEEYEVHPLTGAIRNSKTKRILNSFNYKDGTGRLKFNLRKNGNQHNIAYARILVFAVLGLNILDEELRRFHVDHIDDNRCNDCINNLQLLTAKQNLEKSKFDRKSKSYLNLKKRASKLALVA